jgi:hypothetical protein
MTSLQRVRIALENSGYSFKGITFARYEGQSQSGSEVHLIEFINEDTGEPDEGRVYIKERNGLLYGEF